MRLAEVLTPSLWRAYAMMPVWARVRAAMNPCLRVRLRMGLGMRLRADMQNVTCFCLRLRLRLYSSAYPM